MMSTEAFWGQVAAYNETTWPIALLMTAAAAFTTYRVFRRPGAGTDAWTKAFLAFAFAWNGVAFFLVYVRNPVSMFAGAPLFMAISLLFGPIVAVPLTMLVVPLGCITAGKAFQQKPLEDDEIPDMETGWDEETGCDIEGQAGR